MASRLTSLVAAALIALTATGARGASAPDGTILFVRYELPSEVYSLYTVRPDGTGVHRIAAGVRSQDISVKLQTARLSPDGSHVAFAYTASGLYVADADGTALRRLARGEVRDVSWSPDGRRIAFVKLGEPDRLLIASLTQAPRRLVAARAGAWVAGPAWSPDGRTIAYSYGGDNPRFDQIRVVHPDGSGGRTIVTAADAAGADWSADSRWIAYQRAAGSGWDLYLVRRDGKVRRRLTQTNTVWAGPRWAPTGVAIAYEDLVGNQKPQVVVQPAPGAPPQRIDDDDRADHSGTGVSAGLAWSPDSSRIAFSRDGGADPGLYVSVIGTSAITKIVDGYVGVWDWR